VYRIRNHVINLFVWRADAAAGGVTEARLRGFGIVTWTDDGVRYAAVSDVDPRDLKRFAELAQAR
jgi:anti-sigma factor RsiW